LHSKYSNPPGAPDLNKGYLLNHLITLHKAALHFAMGDMAKTDKGKGKEIRTDPSPPPEPQGKGRKSSPLSEESATKRAAVASEDGHHASVPAEPRTLAGISHPGTVNPWITEDQELQIRAMKFRNPGANVGRVAKSIGGGISEAIVREAMTSIGKVTVEPPGRRWLPAHDAQLHKLTKAGQSVPVIALLMDRTDRDVEDRIRDLASRP